jgi:hypothetical protein
MQFVGKPGGFYSPGKVGGFHFAIADGASYSEAGDVGPKPLMGDELPHDLIQPAVLAAGEYPFRNRGEMTILRLKKG